MIPCCCICGESSEKWHDEEWEDAGGLQDFCPKHSKMLEFEFMNEENILFYQPNLEEWKYKNLE